MAFQTFFKLPNLLIIQKHSGPENLKKSSPKKKIFCLPNSINLQFQKSIFELGKSLKPPKMQFHEKIFLIYLISRVFLPGLFLNFLACCDSTGGVFGLLALNPKKILYYKTIWRKKFFFICLISRVFLPGLF